MAATTPLTCSATSSAEPGFPNSGTANAGNPSSGPGRLRGSSCGRANSRHAADGERLNINESKAVPARTKDMFRITNMNRTQKWTCGL